MSRDTDVDGWSMLRPHHRHHCSHVIRQRGIRCLVAGMLAVMAVLASTGVSAASVAPSAPAVQDIRQLFLQNATRGTLEKLPGRGLYRLQLGGVSPQVSWFSDRPVRDAGVIPMRGFVASWGSFGFSADHPNAVLTIPSGRSRGHTVVLELSRARYTAARRTLRYVARPIRTAAGSLASFQARRTTRLPRRFGAAALFIDDATAPVWNGCVLEPYSQCPGADLTTDGDEGLDLKYVDVNNANFSGANLAQAVLEKANLTDADLSGTNLAGADLGNARLDGANLSGVDLTGAWFFGASITDANLTAATLDGATSMCTPGYCQTIPPGVDYWTSNLSGSNLTDASLVGVNLTWSNFTGVNLTGANLTGVIGWPSVRIPTAILCRTIWSDGTVDNQDCPGT